MSVGGSARSRKCVNTGEEEDSVIISSNQPDNNRSTEYNGCDHKKICKFVLLSLRNISVEPIMFLFMFSTYLYLALVELYFYQQFGLKALRDNSSFDMPNNSFCVNSKLLDNALGNGTNDAVEGRASLLILINSSLGQITSVVVALIAGPLSDKYGRKPILLFALVGNAAGAIVNMFLVYFKVEVYFFIASSLLLGVTGGFTIIMTVCVAYLADVSSQRWLTFRIAVLQAMLYISQALSDVITGQWLKRSGCFFDPLLWLSVGASILGILYLFFVKEPFSKQTRLLNLKDRGGSKISALLLRGFKIFFAYGYSRWRLWFTLIILSISVINGIGAFELLTLFQVHDPLDWGPEQIGWYGLTNTVIQAFSLFVLLPILVAVRVPDSLIVLVGLLFASGMNFFTGFLRTSWEMYLVGILTGLDPAITPIIRAIFSKLVAQKDQGSLFAVVTAVQVLSAAFASVLYNEIFREALKRHMHPGVAFILMGIVGLLPVPLVTILFIRRKGGTPPEVNGTTQINESRKEEEEKLLTEDRDLT